MLEAWNETFGDDYTNRNTKQNRKVLWEKVLGDLNPKSILEVGANIGLNLDAINNLIDTKLIGLEPNDFARSKIKFEAIKGTSEEIPLEDNSIDMVFTCGVLIHIPDIKKSCDEIYRVSSRYIVCIEYFNDKLVEIPYRGQMGLLWKQDFGKFWMDNYPDLRVLDCLFFWKQTTGLDNVTAWIFEKTMEKK